MQISLKFNPFKIDFFFSIISFRKIKINLQTTKSVYFLIKSIQKVSYCFKEETYSYQD
jgi:hypothetical protein